MIGDKSNALNPNARCGSFGCMNYVRLPYLHCLPCLIGASVLLPDGRPFIAPAAQASLDWFSRYLANDKQARKQAPLARGLFGYFPNACLHVAHVSFVANEQHNPG